jgi:hypothetical protein
VPFRRYGAVLGAVLGNARVPRVYCRLLRIPLGVSRPASHERFDSTTRVTEVDDVGKARRVRAPVRALNFGEADSSGRASDPPIITRTGKPLSEIVGGLTEPYSHA